MKTKYSNFFINVMWLCTALFLSSVNTTFAVEVSLENQATQKPELNPEPEVTKYKNAVEQLLQQRLSGLSSNIDGAATLIDSFIDDFEISSLLGGIDGDDETPIVFDYNFKTFGSDDKNVKLQVKLNTNAKISQDLAMELGADNVALLQSNINDTDDIEISFSYDLNSKYFGASFSQNQTLFGEVAMSYKKNPRLEDVNFLILEKGQSINSIDYVPDVLDARSENLFETDCSVLASDLSRKYSDADRGQEATDKAETIRSLCYDYQAILRSKEAIAKSLTSTYQPYEFANLVANQPRLQLSSLYKSRSDLIGPDELSIKVSYSFGATNINSLRRQVNSGNDFFEVYRDHVLCVAKARDTKRAQRASCVGDGKFSLSLEYIDIDDQQYSSNQIEFLRVGGERIEGAIGYSRTLAWDESEPELSLNMSLKFEEYLGDTMGNDRVIATATLNRKINERLSIPISIQYANKSEFLSEADEQVSGNIGLKYDFNFN